MVNRKIFHFIHLKFGHSDLFRISGFGFRILSLFLTASIFLTFLPNPGFAATKGKSVKEGNKLYKEQKYDEALEKYMEAFEKDPDSDVINFDLGTALYKKNNYGESVAYFQKSLLTEDETLKEKTHYNLGNVFYKSGIEKEEKDLHAAVNSLKQSLSEYEKALVLNKDNEDVIFNYDFVKKELERIEKKQQKQKNNKDQKQDSDKSDKQKSDQQKSEDQQQSQSEEEQQQEKQPAGQNEEKSQDSKQAEKDQSQGEQEQQEMKEAREMSKEEAEMLLEGYKQDEEPRELLNFMGRKRSDQPVLKDW